MRTVARRTNPFSFLGSMVWVAVASFVAGFAGFLIIGMTVGR